MRQTSCRNRLGTMSFSKSIFNKVLKFLFTFRRLCVHSNVFAKVDFNIGRVVFFKASAMVALEAWTMWYGTLLPGSIRRASFLASPFRSWLPYSLLNLCKWSFIWMIYWLWSQFWERGSVAEAQLLLEIIIASMRVPVGYWLKLWKAKILWRVKCKEAKIAKKGKFALWKCRAVQK